MRLQLIAFLVGYIQQDIRLTLWFALGGTAIAFLMVVPPWPAYNELPEKWLPAKGGLPDVEVEVDGKKTT